MDLFDFNNHNHEEEAKPLAERMRANSLEEFIGQKHIVAEGSLLRRAIATPQGRRRCCQVSSLEVGKRIPQ